MPDKSSTTEPHCQPQELQDQYPENEISEVEDGVLAL